MDTALDYLRLRRGLTGTKEGCAEGDCGACTVALGMLGDDGRVAYQPVNSCILLTGQLDGRELITVEDLAEAPDRLHPVQRAMAEHHGSQCGFCTPGIVMSLFCLYHQGDRAPEAAAVNDQLAGNLCRCTGYRPIREAAMEACADVAQDRFAGQSAESAAMLAGMRDGEDVFLGDERRFLAIPTSEERLAALLTAHPDAVPVAGATDVGLWITKQLRDLPKIILLQGVESLTRIEETADRLTLGAGVTYRQAETALGALDPDLGELLRRLGSKQVRASGTIGGNIANGSPIGDTPPPLIALGAELELASQAGRRRMPLEAYFLGYGAQDRRPGEYVSSVSVPKLTADQRFRCFKISKRFDQDISALLGAFRFTLEAGRIVGARIAFGGMAATPKRARQTETAIAGLDLEDHAGIAAAADALAEDFTPIDDMRASAAYRLQVAKGLLIKAAAEIGGEDSTWTRVIGRREVG
jgi:xanthine dehydrogenase small subunit